MDAFDRPTVHYLACSPAAGRTVSFADFLDLLPDLDDARAARRAYDDVPTEAPRREYVYAARLVKQAVAGRHAAAAPRRFGSAPPPAYERRAGGDEGGAGSSSYPALG